MGKFPGKPSKIVNRKRIKVSKCSSSKEDDSVKAAETIYYGLTVFNETFGTEEQNTSDFLGFSRKEVQLSVSHARSHLRDSEAECKLNGFDVSLLNSFNQEISQIKLQATPPRRTRTKIKKKKQCFDGGGKCINQEEEDQECSSPQKRLSKVRKKQCFDGGGVIEEQNSHVHENLRSNKSLRSRKIFAASQHSGNTNLKNNAAKKLLQKAMKSCHIPLTNTDCLLHDKSVNCALRKFVLPSRSAHSSRVIKPNKRFIDLDENTGDINTVQTPTKVQLKKPKLILSLDKSEDEQLTNHNTFTFSEGLCEKDGNVSRLGLLDFSSVAGNFSSNSENNTSFSPHEGNLIVEGKRRWKPSYKVQLKLRELNVFGAGTSRFPLRNNIGSNSDASESVNSGSDRDITSQLNSGHVTDRSDSEALVTNTVSDCKVGNNTRVPGTKLNTGSKVILKEARLKLNSQTSSISDGPFSNSMHLGASLPETVECGVCGAVRFYRFVKQARKFGIFSCESCRKFISKMIKRQACAKTSNLPPLECHKGEGMCTVPPIVRSQQWKAGRGTLVRCSYKARCPACWLKMCLRSFKMPDTTRTGLISMLPPEMQTGLNNSKPAVPSHPNQSSEELSTSILNRPFRLGFTDLPVADSNRLPKEWPTPVPVLFQRDPFGHLKTGNSKTKQKRSNGEKSHKQKKSEKEQSGVHKTNSQIQSAKLLKKASKNLALSKDLNPDGSKRKKKSGTSKSTRREGRSLSGLSGSVWSSHRQRIELKGPRVKHVCRSASIVLGQIPATFPGEVQSTDSKSKQNTEAVKGRTNSSCCLDCKDAKSAVPKSAAEKSSFGRNGDFSKNTIQGGTADGKDVTRRTTNIDDTGLNMLEESNTTGLSLQSYRKVGVKNQPMTRSLPVPGKRQNSEILNQVSIDFWESYDPEEVCNTGFGLIGSEPFHVRAICFLCGSGGLEQLIHCASCCEPYHQFCLEDGVRDSGEGWRYNWICQRCTVCHTCGRGQGQQLSCQKCHKTYHTECLGSSRFHSPDRPWVCPSCLRCKSCGAADVTVFVGNLPLCKGCFKLRQKGNYCPLCQRCYEDHDYDTKMMECAKCSCWVHAKCEGLSDEKYQVLSYLPESVEFVCRMCCTLPPAPWWIAVEEELRAGYLNVLKSLSKNRKACAMLKSSPKKQCFCRCASTVKQLPFCNLVELKETSESEMRSESNKTIADCTSDQEIGHDPVIEVHVETGEPPNTFKDFRHTDDSHSVSSPIETSPGPNSDEKLKDNNVEVVEKELLMKKCNSVSNFPIMPDTFANQGTAQLEVSSGQPDTEITDVRSQYLFEKSSPTIDPTLKIYIEKYNIKECSVRVQDILPKPPSKALLPVKVEVPCTDLLQDGTFCERGKSPHKALPASLSTPCSDSGISSTDEELKSCVGLEAKEIVVVDTAIPNEPVATNAEVAEAGYSSSNSEENPVSESEGANSANEACVEKICHCLEVTQSKHSLTLLSVKKKVNASEYSSLLQFHQEMESLISRSQAAELLETYHHTLQEVFPWFDPKFARVSSRPMHEDHFYCQSPSKQQSLDSSDHSCNDDSRILNDLEKEHLDEKFAQIFANKDSDYYYSGTHINDVRVCVLCKGIGDRLSTQEGRLLYCGQNEWTHTNCALWSAEVFEEIDGSLQNVHSAVSRGRMIRCPWCEKRGASVGCCARNCNETYHFPCARKAKCTFMDDKNVYCPTHARDATGKILLLDSEFDVRRPIYVELDRKKKKFSDVPKVKFMIGSLLVDNLGEFVPGASDNPDIIIPNDFRCTRYFWSSVEPWRIVQYHIKTIVNQQLPQEAEDLGWNITIDHSEELDIVQQKLNEVVQWHKDFSNLKSRKFSIASKHIFSESLKPKSKDKVPASGILKNNWNKKEEDNVARQVINYLLDVVCNKEVDDGCLTDPQSTADILPPDLKDAIFEELPHDLLDGISMQDIFPKLMSYEDAVGIDIKSDGSCGSDGLKDGKEDLPDDVILAADVDSIAMLSRGKKMDSSLIEFGSSVESWFSCGDSKEQLQNCSEDIIPFIKNSGQKLSNRELKRSKSEGIPQASSRKVTGCSRSQQRSCSLAWSCKLDGASSAHVKRRKATRPSSRAPEGSSNPVSDTLCSERTYLLQELRIPESAVGGLPRATTTGPSVSSIEGVRELKTRLEDEGSIPQGDRRKTTHPKEEGKENKWLLWHTRSQARILQLDGTVDSSSSGSEGGKSPRRIDDDDDEDDALSNPVRQYPSAGPRRNLSSELLKKDGDEEPVRCSRCHRTYRTRTSFERHLPTCSSDFILSTSESDSENTRSSEEESPKQVNQNISVKLIGVKSESKIPNENGDQLPPLLNLNVSFESPKSSQTSPVESPNIINALSHPSTNNDTSLQVSNKVNSVESVANPNTSSSQTGRLSNALKTSHVNKPSAVRSVPAVTPKTNVNSNLLSQTNGFSASRVKPNTGRSRRASVRSNCQRQQFPRSATSQPVVTSVSAAATTSHTPSTQYQMHVVPPPCAQATAQPTVFVQQVPSPNVVPAFVEAFQQHTGQSLQYIATIDAHTKHPLFTSTPGSIVPNPFQLQTSSDGFTGMQNNNIPVMSGVQLSTPQPTVLGTIIPQAQPAAIQCGVMATEQMVLGSTPGMEVYTDQNGGMFVASQPMFIGLETIVSNTVMQSQQIVSSTLPGVMAASSSFSATTTQVFQSKIEPIVDVPPGFVIVNPPATIPDTRMRNPEIVTCAPTHLPMTLPSQIPSQPPPVNTHQTPLPPLPVSAPHTSPLSIRPPPLVPISVSSSPSTPLAPPVSTIDSHSLLNCCVGNFEPVSVAQSSVVSSEGNVHWKYAQNNLINSSASANRKCMSQVPHQNATNNVCISNNSVSLPVSKVIITSSSSPLPVTISSQPPASPLKVVKTVPTICSTESVHQISSSEVTKPVQMAPNAGSLKNETEQHYAVTIQNAINQETSEPITKNKCVSQNSKTNGLKLILQKQTQDGVYKVTPNQNMRILSTVKQVAALPVNKYVKNKSKPEDIEKGKEQESHFTPTVLQPSHNHNNHNGAVNGTKYTSNGKIPFLKETIHSKDVSPSITFELRSQDGFCCTSSDITEVWQKVFEAVQQARIAHKMPPLPQNPFLAVQDGLQMIGLKHNGLRYLVEQLPGAGRCIKYKPRYHKQHPPSPEDDIDALPTENRTGSARSQPFYKRSPYDMFSWLASRHRQPPKFMTNADGESISNRRATSSNLPMAMRFRHLKETSKEAVGVYRSHIHGRGLFCLRDIDAGEMVIEYAGEVIRSTLTDKREKFYESKGIGCYMFRIDDQLVVDATMRGNAARFINHSCEPNCYSRVVDILGKKHILIFALRRIPQGEELTYDYKFPFEDVKIPCTCGSRRCRKYLN